MPNTRDIWSDDAVRREQAQQMRSDAARYDTTPVIDALAPHVEEKPQGTLLRRISDSWVILANDDDVDRLLISGDYRPLVADERWNESGTLTSNADTTYIEQGRKERAQALAKLEQARQEHVQTVADIDSMTARIASMSPEEQAALEADLIHPIAGIATGLVQRRES